MALAADERRLSAKALGTGRAAMSGALGVGGTSAPAPSTAGPALLEPSHVSQESPSCDTPCVEN